MSSDSIVMRRFSPASLEHARQEALRDGLACEYRQQDLRAGAFGEAFDLVLLCNGELNVFRPQEAAAILETSKKVIEQAREALQLARNRYKAGKGTQLEVLESQLQLTRAQLEQSTARHDMELASIQMKRAIGEEIIQR